MITCATCWLDLGLYSEIGGGGRGRVIFWQGLGVSELLVMGRMI